MKKLAMPVLLVCLVCLVTALYSVSQKVDAKRAELKQAQAQIARIQDNRRALEAEWHYLNRPDRLEALAQRYLVIGDVASQNINNSTILSSYRDMAELPEYVVPAVPQQKPDLYQEVAAR